MASFNLDLLQASIEDDFNAFSGGPPQYGLQEFNIEHLDPWLRDMVRDSDLDRPTSQSPPPCTLNCHPREESITPRCHKKHAEATQVLLKSVGKTLDLCHGDQQNLEVFSPVSLSANTTSIHNKDRHGA